MAGTLGDMKARIAQELARSDLTTQIANAINDAILIYQKDRFRFNESIPDAPRTFNTVAGQPYYTISAQTDIPTVLKLDYVLMNVGNTVFQLKREDPVVVKLYNQLNTMRGQPGWYGYEGNEIIVSAIPDQAYLITLGGYFVVAAPADDNEANNPWMIDAERLIRARAKYEIAVHVTRNPTLAEAMSPNPEAPGVAYREWRFLKSEANRITGRGIVRQMFF